MSFWINYTKEIFFLFPLKKIKILIFIFLGLISSLMDYIGLSVIGPFASLMVNKNEGSLLLNNIFLKTIIDKIQLLVPGDLVLTMTVLIFFIFLLKTILVIWIYYLLIDIKFETSATLGTKLLQMFQTMSYKEYVGRSTAEFLQSVHHNVSGYSNVTMSYLRILVESIIILAVVLFLTINQGLVLFVAVLFFSAFVFLYYLIFKKKIIKLGEAIITSTKNQIEAVKEGMEGFKEITISGKRNFFHDKFKKNAFALINVYNLKETLSFAPRYIIEFLCVSMVMSFSIYYYYSNVATSGYFFSNLAIFGFASLRLIPSFASINTLLGIMLSGRKATSNIYKDISRHSSDKIKQVDKNNFEDKFENLSFKNVSFSYSDPNKPVLAEMNFMIEKGKSVAFIGKSVSGKTTLLDLFLGLIKCHSGEILTNKKFDINKDLRSWYKKVYYLPQDKFLFNDTALNNIILDINISKNIKNDKPNLKKLNEAIQLSRLDKFINELPNGLDTVIGERGITISGGQRQRLVLARALFHDREILVLDEATSSLDNDLEDEINKSVNSLKGKKTIILITHNLNLTKYCDHIYKLENSRVTQIK